MAVNEAWQYTCALEVDLAAFDAFRCFDTFADAGNLLSGNQQVLDSLSSGA